MTDALKAARKVLARWESGGPRPAHASRQELAGALRAALAEVDRLTGPKYECRIHGIWNAARESGCPTCVREMRAEIDRLTASEKRLQWVLPLVTGSNDNAADERTAAMMLAMARGLDGIEAIDFAMKENP